VERAVAVVRRLGRGQSQRRARAGLRPLELEAEMDVERQLR
jgi:hypothetical protein